MQEVFHYKEFNKQQQNLAGSLWHDAAVVATIWEYFFFKKSIMITLEVGLQQKLLFGILVYNRRGFPSNFY